MIGPLRPGVPFEAFVDGFLKDLVGTVGVQIVDGDDNVIQARSTAGITEIAEIGDFARYAWAALSPEIADAYLVVWDDADGNSTSEELIVSYSMFAEGGALPCGEWITGADVVACCEDADVGTFTSLLDSVASIAAGILFQLTGRRFPGTCGPVTVRPCATPGCGICGTQMLSRGYVIHWDFGLGGWCGEGLAPCGCSPLSEVVLAGYPVQSIYAVKIDGLVLDADEYRLDGNRKLVRMRDLADPGRPLYWPSCQIQDLPDTEDGTFSVTYTYGESPPELAQMAAAELACELYHACPGIDGDCKLPSNVRQVVRQGITLDIVTPIAEQLAAGATGLTFVDLLIATYPNQRRAAFWGPDGRQYPRQVG